MTDIKESDGSAKELTPEAIQRVLRIVEVGIDSEAPATTALVREAGRPDIEAVADELAAFLLEDAD